MVVTVDRGRWGCVLGGDPHRPVTAMRARELGRTPIVVGDQVDVVGDLSGRPDTLARIVRRGERRTVLRRTADDTDPTERVVVANADQLLVVVALADPPPRTGLVDRALIAAYAGGIRPILCLTKTDLGTGGAVRRAVRRPGPHGDHRRRDDPLPGRGSLLTGTSPCCSAIPASASRRWSIALCPTRSGPPARSPGSARGRHTSTQSVALPLPGGGWVVDTPGIRSFGLAHIEPDDVMPAFSDLADGIAECPRGCGHLGPPADPECALDALTGPQARRVAAARRLLAALTEAAAY